MSERSEADQKLLERARDALAHYLAWSDPYFENWPLWCLHDEIEEALTGITPATLL